MNYTLNADKAIKVLSFIEKYKGGAAGAYIGALDGEKTPWGKLTKRLEEIDMSLDEFKVICHFLEYSLTFLESENYYDGAEDEICWVRVTPLGRLQGMDMDWWEKNSKEQKEKESTEKKLADSTLKTNKSTRKTNRLLRADFWIKWGGWIGQAILWALIATGVL